MISSRSQSRGSASDNPNSTRPASRFLGAYAVTLGLLAVILCALVTATDPHRYFFGSPFPEIWPNTRRDKVDLFRKYSSHGKVTGFIMGSSRTTLQLPEQADRDTGLRFFNASVYDAATDDYLGLYRLFREIQGAPPKMLIVGIDTVILRSGAEISEELTANYALISRLDANVTVPGHFAGLYAFYFRLQTLTDLGTSFRNLRSHPPPRYVFAGDGHLLGTRFSPYELDYNLGPGLKAFVAEYREFLGVSPQRVDRLRTLTREAAADGVQVVLWLTPLHPGLRAAIDRLPDVPTVEREARAIVSGIGARYGARVVDLSDPESFAGNPSMWLVSRPRERSRRWEGTGSPASSRSELKL